MDGTTPGEPGVQPGSTDRPASSPVGGGARYELRLTPKEAVSLARCVDKTRLWESDCTSAEVSDLIYQLLKISQQPETANAAMEPELGQLVFGGEPGEFALPEYAGALFAGIVAEIERVYGNRSQHRFDPWSDDPDIPGITWSPYYYGEDEERQARPNFVFENVEIRWYKNIGRSMSVNVNWTSWLWVGWFDRCLATIRASDRKL